jgi:hypothetical protein
MPPFPLNFAQILQVSPLGPSHENRQYCTNPGGWLFPLLGHFKVRVVFSNATLPAQFYYVFNVPAL